MTHTQQLGLEVPCSSRNAAPQGNRGESEPIPPNRWQQCMETQAFLPALVQPQTQVSTRAEANCAGSIGVQSGTQAPWAPASDSWTTLPSLLCCCFIICALECKQLPPHNLPLALPYSVLRYFCSVVEAIKCRMRKRPVAVSTSTRCTLKINHVNGAGVLLLSVPNRTLCDLIMLLAAA